MSINSWTISGNLGGDPETRFTPDGKQVTNFSLPINKTKDGNKYVHWVKCTAWEKVGALIAEYCKKGQKITVSGRFDFDSYTNDSGQIVHVTQLIVNQVELPARNDIPQNTEQQPPTQQNINSDDLLTEDDILF